MKKTISSIILVLMLLFLNHCGTTGSVSPSKVKYPNAVSSEAKTDFNRAEKLFETANYEEADKLYKAYLKQYPYNELSDKSDFRLGQILMLRQNYAQAVQSFKALIKKSPSLEIKSKSNLKLALCYYRLQKMGETLSSFAMVEPKYADPREKVKMSSVALKILGKEDVNKRAFYLALLVDEYEGFSDDAEIQKQFGKEAPSKAEVEKQFQEWVKLATPIEAIDRRLLDYRGKSSGASLDFKIGKSYYESKNNAKAKEYLKRYVSKYPKHNFVEEANKILAGLGAAAVPVIDNKNGIKIGVILPLSGKLEQYGNYALKGMECAASLKPECKGGVSNVKLLVKDSMGDAQKSATLVEELVKEKVSLILGPLPSAEVETAAAKAKELGVVLVALSQKKDIPALGENIFRFSLTPAAQTRAILKHLSSQKDQNHLAIFYPNNNYGQEFLSEFESQVSGYGVKIVSKQSFAPTKADLTGELRQLKLNSTNVKENGKLFDSIFIPDSYQNIGKIAAGFEKAELSGLSVIGSNAWNDASIISKFNNSLNSGLFVDLYFKDSTKEITQNFNREFQNAYSYAPSSLEAMGYDIVRFVSQALGNKKVSAKDQVKSALVQIQNYNGVTGLKGFDDSREALISPVFIGVDANGFKEIQ
ncbi:MAG: penicillin-binding protein activator [Deltaproteobacteria bacterium]|nr:penicillin-binding protein activator [Deltaproteobacteria bacterium]